MKKRVLVAICVLALLVCGIVMATAAEDATTLNYTCQHCNAEVEWVPVVFGSHMIGTEEDTDTMHYYASETHLHYYLDRDYSETEAKQIILYSGMEMCLDLHGQSLDVAGRAFNLQEGDVALSIMDSSQEGTGSVHSTSAANSNNVSGGTILVGAGDTLNIYGGTFSLENDATLRTDSGGVICAMSNTVCNISGGTIVGGDVELLGGAILLLNNAQLNLSGDATITAGTAGQAGNCVYVNGHTTKVTLSDNASVDELYFTNRSHDDPNLTVIGEYTGSANLYYVPENHTDIAEEWRVAWSDGANIDNALLRLANDSSYYIISTGDFLVLTTQAPNRVTKTCQYCGTDVEWIPIIFGNHRVGTGTETDTVSTFYHTEGTHLHYYLGRDFSQNMVKQMVIHSGITLCLDLNGHTIESPGRMFNALESGSVINIMDLSDEKTGQVNAHARPGGNNIHGGVMVVNTEAELNVYGGTYTLTNDETQYTTRGGIIYIYSGGTCNLYGGIFNGADVKTSGGAIYVSNNAVLNLYNNVDISNGSAAKGNCIYAAGRGTRINLSGSASVDDIYIEYNIDNQYCLTVSGEYTGMSNMQFNPENVRLSEGVSRVGVSDNAVISGKNLHCSNDLGYWVTVEDGYLVVELFGPDDVAGIITKTTEIGYPSLAKAIEAYTGDGYISMLKDTDENVTFGMDTTIALNGCDLNGEINVDEGCTLYGMDSKTDDYDVEDDDYGRIQTINGNVEGVIETTGGYLKIVEEDGVSFHKVNLKLTAMVLRAMDDGVCAPSVYYQSDFMGDRKVAGKVLKYGIALSVLEMPNENNIDDDNEICHCSWFEGFTPGIEGNSGNGTLLKGILKPDNAKLVNNRNAKSSVFGRAYILTEDGYMFGDGHSRTLEEQTMAADENWEDLTSSERQSLKIMCNTYSSIIKNWDLPNLNYSLDPSNDNALKVLVVGNTHSLDATNQLYDVFREQGYNGDLVLGVLSRSNCSMSTHANYMSNKLERYDYYRNDSGSWTVTEGTSALTALRDEQWDVVVLQQANNKAATEEEYVKNDFLTVINYIKANQINTPKFAWHMVWSDPGDSAMYGSIVECTQAFIESDNAFLGSNVFDFVIPSATAIAHSQEVMGLSQEDLYAENANLNDRGDRMMAYLWYAKLTGLDAFSLEDTDSQIDGIESINWALANPYALPVEAAE